MKFIREIQRLRAAGQMRPLWQIVLIAPVFPIYAGMRWIVEKVEGR